jgi:hypothetical protein
MLTKAKEVERWQRWQRQSCLVRNVKNHISSLEKICHAFFDILSVFQVLDLSIVDQNQTQYPIWQIWQGWSTAAGYNEKQFWVGTKDKGGKGRERWEPKQPLQSFPLFFLDESVQNLMGHQNCLNLSRLFGQILGYDLEDVIAKGPEEKLEAQEAPGDPYSLTFYDLCASTQLTSYIPVVTNLGHPNHPNPTLPRVLSATKSPCSSLEGHQVHQVHRLRISSQVVPNKVLSTCHVPWGLEHRNLRPGDPQIQMIQMIPLKMPKNTAICSQAQGPKMGGGDHLETAPFLQMEPKIWPSNQQSWPVTQPEPTWDVFHLWPHD